MIRYGSLLGRMLSVAMLAACAPTPPPSAPTAAPQATAITQAAATAKPADTAPATSPGRPILIGAHGDRARQASYYTLLQKDVLDFWVEEVNAAGGIDGRPVQVLFEDDENNPQQATTRTEKLASQDVSFIISIGSSATGLAAQAKAEELRIPIGSPTNTADQLTEPLRKYYFRVALNDSVQAKGMTTYLSRNFDNPKIAVVRDGTETGLTLSDNYVKGLRAANLNVIATEQITPGSPDVSAQVSRIREAQPDVVLVGGSSVPDLANYVKAHKAAGLQMPMIGSYLFTVPAFLDLTKDASDGLVYTDSVDPARSEVKAIEDKLAMKLGDKARNAPFVIHAYEFCRLIGDAIKRAGSDDRETIRNAMEQTKDFAVAMGPPTLKLSYSPEKHDLFDSGDQVVFRELRDGKFGPVVPLR
jgi:branched-chain amino acid transport system substrate-binding protein